LQALHPKWDELAKKLQANKDKVVIAKIDATANDLPPQYPANGFPTIYWVSRGKGTTPQRYDGGREVKDLEAYVRSHVSTPLKDEL
jgi:protein disulfide isomerase family A protein 3